MVKKFKSGALTVNEKKIAKNLLQRGERNQDIQALINVGRKFTINSARITEVKKNNKQIAASDDETDFYISKKHAYDPQTGLNLYDDERLIRAREAMILAVQVFNSAGLKFKTEVFSVLANVAWTYLLHEYYERKKVQIIGKDGRSLLLSQMIKRHDCPLSTGVRDNLSAMKVIRDEVEHKILGKSELKWRAIFQACCLNFDKTICSLFGQKLSLSKELSFALQFTKTDFDQLTALSEYEIPAHIQSLDARLIEGMTEDRLNDLEYQFKVIYTVDSASKSNAHIKFIKPESEQGENIRQVLVQLKPADDLYPYRASDIWRKVTETTGLRFSSHNHTQAWRYYKIRPKIGTKNAGNTQKDFCIYHSAHKDYTYSEKWLELLCQTVSDKEELKKIKAIKI